MRAGLGSERLMNLKRFVWFISLSAFLLLATVVIALSQDKNDYVGWEACQACHEAVTRSWLQTRHAKAFDSLKNAGKGDSIGCIECHVTGYEKQGGFIDFELTPELVGVQCEECHGSGKEHVETQTKNTIIKTVGIGACRRCHTVGQDPKFNYQEKVKNVHPLQQEDKTIRVKK